MPDTDKPPPPDWMVDSVAAGLQHFLLLRLPGFPPAETIAGTAHAWADAFWRLPKAWDKDLDALRITAAFRIAAGQVDRFPAPKTVIAAMPPRPPQKALPPPEMSEEKRRANLKRLAELLGTIKRKGPAKRKPMSNTRAAAITAEQEEALLEEIRQYKAKK